VNAYEKCVIGLKPRLNKKGVENAEIVAQNMCSMWADNNGEEKEFGVSKSDETQKTFAMNFEYLKKAWRSSMNYQYIILIKGLLRIYLGRLLTLRLKRWKMAR
jgi:pyruvate/2-oxoacid:ferredoxin oxidoreductase beta subunit